MDHANLLEQAEFYALKVLEGEDLRAFEAHLASGCEDCRQRIRDTERLVSELSSPLGPPGLIKKLSTNGSHAGTERPRSRLKWIVIVLLAVLLAAGLVLMRSRISG